MQSNGIDSVTTAIFISLSMSSCVIIPCTVSFIVMKHSIFLAKIVKPRIHYSLSIVRGIWQLAVYYTGIWWSRRKIVNTFEANVFDVVVRVEVEPQIFVARADYRRKLVATKSAQNIGETIFAVSHLWPVPDTMGGE